MSAANLKIAKKWYPKYWTITMVVALVEKGKLTEDEYLELTGFVYPATSAEESDEDAITEE